MENPQLAQSATQGDEIKQDAEKHFRRFWSQIFSRNSHGLLSEIENGKKVFSFETYLRATGNAEFVDAYCTHIKVSNYVSTMTNDSRFKWSKRMAGSLSLMMFFIIAILPGIFLYLLLVAFLATFDISFWDWLPATLFALTGPVIAGITVIPQFWSSYRESKTDISNVLYIVKNFDSDELTFLRTNSKLFVEEKEQ